MIYSWNLSGSGYPHIDLPKRFLRVPYEVFGQSRTKFQNFKNSTRTPLEEIQNVLKHQHLPLKDSESYG